MNLRFDLIPSTASGQNVRKRLSERSWDMIRKIVYRSGNNICQICKESDQLLDAHEVWEWYEENHIQKLVNIIGICRLCHDTIHFDRAEEKGIQRIAKEHFIELNHCKIGDFENELLIAKLNYDRRSKIEQWKIDDSWLFNKAWIRHMIYDKDPLNQEEKQVQCDICGEFYHEGSMIGRFCLGCK